MDFYIGSKLLSSGYVLSGLTGSAYDSSIDAAMVASINSDPRMTEAARVKALPTLTIDEILAKALKGASDASDFTSVEDLSFILAYSKPVMDAIVYCIENNLLGSDRLRAIRDGGIPDIKGYLTDLIMSENVPDAYYSLKNPQLTVMPEIKMEYSSMGEASTISKAIKSSGFLRSSDGKSYSNCIYYAYATKRLTDLSGATSSSGIGSSASEYLSDSYAGSDLGYFKITQALIDESIYGFDFKKMIFIPYGMWYESGSGARDRILGVIPAMDVSGYAQLNKAADAVCKLTGATAMLDSEASSDVAAVSSSISPALAPICYLENIDENNISQISSNDLSISVVGDRMSKDGTVYNTFSVDISGCPAVIGSNTYNYLIVCCTSTYSESSLSTFAASCYYSKTGSDMTPVSADAIAATVTNVSNDGSPTYWVQLSKVGANTTKIVLSITYSSSSFTITALGDNTAAYSKKIKNIYHFEISVANKNLTSLFGLAAEKAYCDACDYTFAVSDAETGTRKYEIPCNFGPLMFGGARSSVAVDPICAKMDSSGLNYLHILNKAIAITNRDSTCEKLYDGKFDVSDCIPDGTAAGALKDTAIIPESFPSGCQEIDYIRKICIEVLNDAQSAFYSSGSTAIPALEDSGSEYARYFESMPDDSVSIGNLGGNGTLALGQNLINCVNPYYYSYLFDKAISLMGDGVRADVTTLKDNLGEYEARLGDLFDIFKGKPNNDVELFKFYYVQLSALAMYYGFDNDNISKALLSPLVLQTLAAIRMSDRFFSVRQGSWYSEILRPMIEKDYIDGYKSSEEAARTDSDASLKFLSKKCLNYAFATASEGKPASKVLVDDIKSVSARDIVYYLENSTNADLPGLIDTLAKKSGSMTRSELLALYSKYFISGYPISENFNSCVNSDFERIKSMAKEEGLI